MPGGVGAGGEKRQATRLGIISSKFHFQGLTPYLFSLNKFAV